MKTTAVISLCCIVALSVVGCSSPGSGDIEIVFAAGNDPSGATEALVDEYNAAHPGVLVKFQAMPASTDTQHDAYVTYLSARESNIDLYSLDVIWTAEFARAGWIVELPVNYIQKDTFLEGPLQSVTYAGKLYAVPWFTDAGVLYYRKDLLEEAGLPVPETWTEFREACREVAGSRGMEGFVWQGARYEGLVCDFLEFLWSVGGDLDRETLIERPAAAERGIVEALGLMLSFLESDISPGGVLTYKEEDSRRLFTEGQALFLRNWPYAWSMAEGEGSKIKGLAGIAPLPHSEGNTGYSTIGGWNVALSSYSKHPDEALEFLRFITGEKSMKERAIKGGYLPTLKSTYGDPDVLDANPHFSRFFEVFQNTRNRPRSPHYPRISDVIQENVHRALTYGIEPEAAAANIVRELAEIMAE
ncbi:MAG: ABC transporter substrate-binding protein [Candidatus Eisenbacteria bacterium]